MAFEKLYTYTDKLAQEYSRTKDMAYIFSLTYYYETILSHAKFKHQKYYCKETIKKIAPAYYEGYFKEKN